MVKRLLKGASLTNEVPEGNIKDDCLPIHPLSAERTAKRRCTPRPCRGELLHTWVTEGVPTWHGHWGTLRAQEVETHWTFART